MLFGTRLKEGAAYWFRDGVVKFSPVFSIHDKRVRIAYARPRLASESGRLA
jgi:hypothetical protein